MNFNNSYLYLMECLAADSVNQWAHCCKIKLSLAPFFVELLDLYKRTLYYIID